MIPLFGRDLLSKLNAKMTFDLVWLDVELLSEEAHAFQLALLGQGTGSQVTDVLKRQLGAGKHGSVS